MGRAQLPGAAADIARQITTFGVVGVTATTVHVAVALGVNALAHVRPILANCAGYGCAFAVSYLGNCVFTFRRPPMHGRQFARFVVISLAGFALNQAIVYLAVERAHYPFKIVLVVAVLTVAAATFAASRLWGFRHPEPAES